MARRSYAHLLDRVAKSKLKPRQKVLLLVLIGLTRAGESTCYASKEVLKAVAVMGKTAIDDGMKTLRHHKLIKSKIGPRSSSHEVDEERVMRLGRAASGDPLFLPAEAKADPEPDGDKGNASGTPDADGDGPELPKAKKAKKPSSAAPEARTAPVTDDDLPAELLDADGDGAVPTPAPATTPRDESTLPLFGGEPEAAAPETPAADPGPSNVVPLPTKARTFKYGDTIERIGEGPFKTKEDLFWAQAVDLYVLHCEQVEAHRGARGIKARYTYTKRAEGRIRKIRTLLRAAEGYGAIAAAIRGVFHRPFNMGENKDGALYFEIETICADGGSKLNLYGGFDPENDEARQERRRGQRRAASGRGGFAAAERAPGGLNGAWGGASPLKTCEILDDF